MMKKPKLMASTHQSALRCLLTVAGLSVIGVSPFSSLTNVLPKFRLSRVAVRLSRSQLPMTYRTRFFKSNSRPSMPGMSSSFILISRSSHGQSIFIILYTYLISLIFVAARFSIRVAVLEKFGKHFLSLSPTFHIYAVFDFRGFNGALYQPRFF